MPAVIPPELNDEVTEAVQNLGVVMEMRRCLNVSNGAQPSLNPLELTELFLERRQNGECRQSSGVIALFQRQITPDEALCEDLGSADRRVAGNVRHSRMHVH